MTLAWTDARTISPILVGRDRELAALDRLIERAESGTGDVVLIGGEAGVGKSRLAAGADGRAASRGFRVLRGQCFETDRAIPYAPLLDLLWALFAELSPDQIRTGLGSSAGVLVRLLPELGDLLPGVAPVPVLDPEQQTRQLVHALTELLIDLAGRRPLLLIVEDLHWSDDATRAFLLHLARRVRTHRILLLLTYRSDETQPNLDHLLAELDRGRLAAELRLSRLSEDGVDDMLRAIFALERPARADFRVALYALTDGNPFFVEEVLKSLVAAGDVWYRDGAWDRKPLSQIRIPRTIEDAVRRRVERLSRDAHEALVLAAVAGLRIEVALLRELTGRDQPGLVAMIKELISAQLIVEESAEQLAFRHALTRQAVYAQLLALERADRHRQVADTIERLHAGRLEPHLNDLAYHFFEAGAWDKSLDYGRRAGERALATCAFGLAVEQFGRALDAGRRLNLPEPIDVQRLRGQAYEALGEFDLAREDYEAALALARGDTERRAEWQARLDLGFLWVSRDYRAAGEHFQATLALAREIDDPLLLARSLNRVGNWLVNVGRPREGLGHHEKALAMVEELDDRAGLAETLDLLGLAAWHVGDADQGVRCYERAAELFRELGNRRALASCLAMLAQMQSIAYAGPPAGTGVHSSKGIAYGEQALALAREIGWRTGEAFALQSLAMSHAAAGAYDRALATTRSGLTIADEIEHRQWSGFARLCLGGYYLDLFALPLARPQLESARALAEEIGSAILRQEATALLAMAYLQEGNLDQAEAILSPILGPNTKGPVGVVGMEWLGQSVRAELALARGKSALALSIADQLRESVPNLPTEAISPACLLLRARSLVALGRPEEAEAAFVAGLRSAASRGILSREWQLHAELGRFYRSRRRFDEAARESAEALRIVEELVARVPEDPVPELAGVSLRARFLQGALERLPANHPPTRLKAAKQEFGGLTTREREVALLIARGHSNREVAAALVVGEATVESHVSSILGKLGFTSRTQVAAWAVEKGLVPPR